MQELQDRQDLSREKAEALLHLLYDRYDSGFFTIWAKGKDYTKVTRWYDLSSGTGSIEKAAGKALELDAQGFDVYVSTCPARTRGRGGSRINQKDVCSISALFMDCDVGKPDCPATKDELRDQLLSLPVPPSFIVDSGSGYHAYWSLEELFLIADSDALSEGKRLLKGFAQGIANMLGYPGFDVSASEPARVLRVPGTHNRKREVPEPVDVIHESPRRYTLEELLPYVKGSAAPPKPTKPATKSEPHLLQLTDKRAPKGLTKEALLRIARRGKDGDRFARLWNGDTSDYPSQSEADLALCNKLCFYTGNYTTGADPVRMDELFRKSGLYRSEKWDEIHGAQTYGELTIGKAIDTTTNFFDPQHKPPAAELPENSPFTRYARAYELVGGYAASRGMLLAESIDKQGEITTKPLANFVPLITEEVTRDDGVDTRKEFMLEGITATGKLLPPAPVPTGKFAAMCWPIDAWGADANIFPGTTVKDKMRFAVQEASRPLLTRSTVYTHSGWRRINGKTVYLYHGGAIGIDGVTVELSGSPTMYSLPDATGDVKEAATASREMLEVLPPRVAIPLLAHMYLAPLYEPMERTGCAPAYVLYLSGKSGTRKTTAAALALNHFGTAFNPKRLPASFNDTANNVQEKAFELKDMPLLVDDYCPTLNQIEQRRRAGIAQQLIRAWGDRAERGRMRADGTLHKAKPPRGLGMMTGEDIPSIGESGLARLYLVEIRPGEIEAGAALTALQRKAQAGELARAMRGYIEWLLPQYDDLPEMLNSLFMKYRDAVQERLDGAHGRQPEAVAWLLVGFQMMLRYWQASGALGDSSKLWAQAIEILLDHSENQRQTIRDEEPVGMFLDALQEMDATGTVNVHRIGEPYPMYDGEKRIGFCDDDFIYLLPGPAFGKVQEHFKAQGTIFPLTSGGLWKRMSEAELIEVWGKATSKNKYITGAGSPRVVWVKRASVPSLFNRQEVVAGGFEV